MHTTRTFIPARLVLAGFLASTGLFAVAQTDAGAADGATVDQTITCDADSMTTRARRGRIAERRHPDRLDPGERAGVRGRAAASR